MCLLLAECYEKEDFTELHDTVGHNVFVTKVLNFDEKREVEKVHRYFGHKSGRKVWEMFAKVGKLRNKRSAVLELINKCTICRNLKKCPLRPKVGMPVANTFNDIVALDLKVLGTSGNYILWMIDVFTKAIKGKYIKNKHPETIVQGILEGWIHGDGFGPGHPNLHFFSDNGGEFCNNEVIEFAATLNTKIKMTSSNSPWQNGIIERHHYTADLVYEKIMSENPKMNPQVAVNYAAFAKNCETSRSGFSPLQLVMGRNPSFPGLSDISPGNYNLDNSSKAMRALNILDKARVTHREFDCSEKLKKVKSQKINPSVEAHYSMGDSVLFRDAKRKVWMRGTALVQYGKTLYLKYENFLRRVPLDTLLPDQLGAELEEEEYVEPLIDPIGGAQYQSEETPVSEMKKDIEVAEELKEVKSKVISLEEENQKLRDLVKDQVDSTDKADGEVDETLEQEVDKRKDVELNRKLRRKRQKEKKLQSVQAFPKLGQHIMFKEEDSEEWFKGKVYLQNNQAS